MALAGLPKEFCLVLGGGGARRFLSRGSVSTCCEAPEVSGPPRELVGLAESDGSSRKGLEGTTHWGGMEHMVELERGRERRLQ